jgi:hypothetical protein
MQFTSFITWLTTSSESPPNLEVLDTYLEGDLESIKEGLVLGDIIRCREWS